MKKAAVLCLKKWVAGCGEIVVIQRSASWLAKTHLYWSDWVMSKFVGRCQTVLHWAHCSYARPHPWFVSSVRFWLGLRDKSSMVLTVVLAWFVPCVWRSLRYLLLSAFWRFGIDKPQLHLSSLNSQQKKAILVQQKARPRILPSLIPRFFPKVSDICSLSRDWLACHPPGVSTHLAPAKARIQPYWSPNSSYHKFILSLDPSCQETKSYHRNCSSVIPWEGYNQKESGTSILLRPLVLLPHLLRHGCYSIYSIYNYIRTCTLYCTLLCLYHKDDNHKRQNVQCSDVHMCMCIWCTSLRHMHIWCNWNEMRATGNSSLLPVWKSICLKPGCLSDPEELAEGDSGDGLSFSFCSLCLRWRNSTSLGVRHWQCPRNWDAKWDNNSVTGGQLRTTDQIRK